LWVRFLPGLPEKATPSSPRQGTEVRRRFSRKNKECFVADKPVKAKQPVKPKKTVDTKATVRPQQPPVKAKPAQARAATVEKKDQKEKPQTKTRQPGRLVRWWRETIGELRKVTWPTVPEARRLTYIVLIVVAATSLLLGFLDLVFSRLIGLLINL
jgi:preprotein translocase subunit SecE